MSSRDDLGGFGVQLELIWVKCAGVAVAVSLRSSKVT